MRCGVGSYPSTLATTPMLCASPLASHVTLLVSKDITKVVFCSTAGLTQGGVVGATVQDVGGPVATDLGDRSTALLVPHTHADGADVLLPASASYVFTHADTHADAADVLMLSAGIAIGGDTFPGSTLSDHCIRYQNIPQIKMIVVLGELGGTDEYSLVNALKEGKFDLTLTACAQVYNLFLFVFQPEATLEPLHSSVAGDSGKPHFGVFRQTATPDHRFRNQTRLGTKGLVLC